MRRVAIINEPPDLHNVMQSVVAQLKQQGMDVFYIESTDRAGLEQADLLICFNLAGFERSTLMGGLSFNLLKCKQIHFILDEKLTNEKMLEKQLSISMFFYAAGAEYSKYLSENYPHIPYLQQLKNWETDRYSALYHAIEEVLHFCNF